MAPTLQAEPSNFTPIYTNRIVTGLYTNRSPLRDASTSLAQERSGLGRYDSILTGYNSEISVRLTLKRRAGSSVYNPSLFEPIKRFYSFNTFSLTDEIIRVMADTAEAVYDATAGEKFTIWTKSPGAGSTYFLGVGNILYMTNGVDNKQWNYYTNSVTDWGIDAPLTKPIATQMPRYSPYPRWQANTVYGIGISARPGVIIIDDSTAIDSGSFAILPLTGSGNVAIGCGQDLPAGSNIPLPTGFDNTRIAVWTGPGTGFAGPNVNGVYQSSGAGGYVNSSFQNRPGGFGVSATSHWIAIAWDAAAETSGSINVTSSAGFTTLKFQTAFGDSVAIVIGSAYHGSSFPVPTGGYTTTNMRAMLAMASADGANHEMSGVLTLGLTGGNVLQGTYTDFEANHWHGNINAFVLFWKGEHATTESVTNGFAINFPMGGSDTTSFVFSTSLLNGGAYGLPAASAGSRFFDTCSMTGYTLSPDNNGHGWSVSNASQNLTAYYRDGSGHQWDGYASGMTIAYRSTASEGNLQWFNGNGQTGATEPVWLAHPPVGHLTADGTITWTTLPDWHWQSGNNYALGDVVIGRVSSGITQLYICTTPGTSGSLEPEWQPGPQLQIQDNSAVWTCAGRVMNWTDVGGSTNVTNASTVLDSNGYLQAVNHAGKSAATEPTWDVEIGSITVDNTVNWTNKQSFSPAGTAPVQYGYAYQNSSNKDLSNMSPPSDTITVLKNNQITIQGDASPDYTDDKVVIYKTAPGGSTFFYLDTISDPPPGTKWSYTDNSTTADLTLQLQAQVLGEGTPLPKGATCLGYHLGRIFAAVGNVVYVSTGPDAIVSGSSGNAGFNTTFTAQSKITRFWVCPLGMVVFTVRDAYIILGTATDSDPLYMVVFIDNLPLRSYDAFTLNKTTPYMMLGNNQLVALDPSAGITEVGYAIADRLEEEFDSSSVYVTFHTEATRDAALYVGNGNGYWYRMNATNAPEQGNSWSTKALIPGLGAIQSVEVLPGVYRLLMGNSDPDPSPILKRDRYAHTDNGTPFPVRTVFGNIVLAQPGQLAALSFVTLEAARVGTRAGLALLLGEISGKFDVLKRTHQDPTNLPPSTTLYSDRYHFEQNQKTAWCRHFQMEITWPPEDFNNELLTYTFFGQLWQETRSQ